MAPFSESNARQSLAMAIDKVNENAYGEALAICRNLIASEPEDRQLVAKAHLVAGRAYRLLRQLEASERELKMGLQLDDSQAQGYADLGMICIHQKRYSEAISYLRTARECPHTDAYVRLTLAIAWMQARQYGEAYSELESLLSSHDHNLPRGGLQILRGIAWYGKIGVARLLLVIPIVLALMLPPTRVWVWVLLTLLTLGALLVLYRSELLKAGAPALVFNHLVLTSIFLVSFSVPK